MNLNNVQTITLPEVSVSRTDLEEVCLAIVHSVLFVRVIGPQEPREGHIHSLDVHYVCISLLGVALCGAGPAVCVCGVRVLAGFLWLAFGGGVCGVACVWLRFG